MVSAVNSIIKFQTIQYIIAQVSNLYAAYGFIIQRQTGRRRNELLYYTLGITMKIIYEIRANVARFGKRAASEDQLVSDS